MDSNDQAKRSAFVVIQKNRTVIWEDNFERNRTPVIIYEPDSIPKGVHHNLDVASSTYDVATTQRANKEFKLLAGWMRPNLNYYYETRIYAHVKSFDHIFLVGGGIGRWSGINNFMAFIDQDHPHFLSRITHERRFRLTDFPESVLFEIFREMSS